jgi:hypothetical protein
MEIKKTKYSEVEKEFSEIKPDLLDENAIYYGVFLKDELVGIVSYVENPTTIYLCHAFVKEEYRNSKIKDSNKQIYAHCNVDSLKHFINNGYRIEKALFKVSRI